MRRQSLLTCMVASAAASTAMAVPPTIHVAWDEATPPVADTHYRVTTSDPDFPDVELITGSTTWRIWSTDPDNPNGIGDIGDITATGAANYSIRLASNTHAPGARNVKSVVLDPNGNFRSDVFAALVDG